MATVLLLASRQPGPRALVGRTHSPAARRCQAATLLMCDRIRRLLGDSVVSAIEKLMGLVLTRSASRWSWRAEALFHGAVVGTFCSKSVMSRPGHPVLTADSASSLQRDTHTLSGRL